MINEDQEEKEGIEVSRFYPSDEPNPMSGHKNKLLPSDEGMNKTSNHGNTNKNWINYSWGQFFCHTQFLITNRDQGINWYFTYTGFSHIIIPIS